MQWENDEIVKWVPSEADIRALRTHFESISKERAAVAKAIQLFPEYVNHIRREAEEAFADMVQLPGNREKSFIGNPPSWLEKRYDDKEYLWQMNRMHHWSWMCFGYALSHDEKYGAKVCSELRFWRLAVPEDYSILKTHDLEYFSLCHPLRILEVGIRLHRSWPHLINFLYTSPSFTDDVIRDLAESVHYQASLLRIVSPAMWPEANHNHFLMEMAGLLTASLYFPVFPEAEEWKNFAIAQLERAAVAQLTESGGQIEGCPSYHDGCMFWFGLPLVFEKRFGIKLSDEYKRRYRKSLAYSLFAMRPTGKSVPVGDSHASDRAVISGMYAYECFNDSSILNTLRLYMSRDNIEHVAEEFVWYLSDTEKVLNFIRNLTPETPNLPLVFYNEVLGQGIVKSDWKSDGSSVLMTCRSPIFDNHAHIDLNSFDYVAEGKVIISDPGYFCYRENEDRRTFKTTAYHSTIMVNGKDMFEYISSFRFGAQRNGKILSVKDEKGYKAITGWHDSYSPVEHLRHIILSDDGYLIIVDALDNAIENVRIHSNFHFDYTDIRLSESTFKGYDEKVNVMMSVYPKETLRFTPGRISDKNEHERPSSMISFDKEITGKRTVFISVIHPYKKKPPVIDISGENECFTLSVNGKKHSLILREKELSFLNI